MKEEGNSDFFSERKKRSNACTGLFEDGSAIVELTILTSQPTLGFGHAGRSSTLRKFSSIECCVRWKRNGFGSVFGSLLEIVNDERFWMKEKP